MIKKTVTIQAHEQDAIEQMLIYLRATAGVLGENELSRKLGSWSAIIEQFLERELK